MNALVKRNHRNHLRPVYDRFFDEFFNQSFPSFFYETPEKFSQIMKSIPTANISESETAFNIDFAAPGYEKENLKISLEDNGKTLIVKAEMSNDSSEEQGKSKENDGIFHREHCYSSFERSFTLPDSVDVKNISAAYKRGVLKIQLPKKQAKEESSIQNIDIQ